MMLIFSVIKPWITVKKVYRNTKLKKKRVDECSQIRKHIMKDNDGCVYVGISRCYSFDHFFEPQCYICYEFNHLLVNAQLNAGPRKTRVCNRKSQEKCVNCLQKP